MHEQNVKSNTMVNGSDQTKQQQAVDPEETQVKAEPESMAKVRRLTMSGFCHFCFLQNTSGRGRRETSYDLTVAGDLQVHGPSKEEKHVGI